ncbi:protein of unknown function [Methanoculleus bourgensis]|uniref:Uncharacterized protein n=1 Tax=Methanoculleus bourgensis TaxID=83986 RepID=A0A0X3BHQ5_9EURY|nr:protein of unknown function [Methanoculleus bourgensis]
MTEGTHGSPTIPARWVYAYDRHTSARETTGEVMTMTVYQRTRGARRAGPVVLCPGAGRAADDGPRDHQEDACPVPPGVDRSPGERER